MSLSIDSVKVVAEVAEKAGADPRTVIAVALSGEMTPIGRSSRARQRIAALLRARGVPVPSCGAQPMAAITSRGGCSDIEA